MRTQSRAEHLHIRASQRDKSTLALAARIKKQTISQFVLESALPLAEHIVAEETQVVPTVFQLDSDAWAEFVRLLDAPPREMPELRSLLASRPVWEH